MFNFKKKEPVKIRFLFDPARKRMTWKMLKIVNRMQSGATDAEQIQLLAARFMTDDKGEYLSEEKAIQILDDLGEDEIADVLKQFTEAMQSGAINPQSGNGSSLPSAVGQEVAFPDGSQP